MLLSAVSVLVVAQSSSEIPEGLMNNPILAGRIQVWIVKRRKDLSSDYRISQKWILLKKKERI